MSWHKGFINADELRAARKTVGWSQADLGKRAGFSLRAVAYHEQKKGGRIDGVAPAAFRAVLLEVGATLAPLPPRRVPPPSTLELMMYSRPAKIKVLRDQDAPRPAKPPPLICGAKKRDGDPCKAKGVPGKKRCRNHGGLSTGPRTAEGLAIISRAQVNRHALSRQLRQPDVS